MSTEQNVRYDESKIKTLDSLEHIRLRSGMYIGRLGDGSHYDDGIYVLLKEVLDNSIDEFIMGSGRVISLSLEEQTIRVRDYGRGIPLGKVVDCVSIINTGAKYNNEVFQFSVGLNGIGTKAVNALSSHFRVISYRDGAYTEAFFSRGKLLHTESNEGSDEPNGTYVEFIPDTEIFGTYEFRREYIEKRLWNYAYLNRNLRIDFDGNSYYSRSGLKDLLNAEIEEDQLYDICYYRAEDERLEFAFTHTENYGETHFSFVNGQYTSGGGTHQSFFREGILRGIREFYGKNYAAQDVRDGVVGAISIRIMEPIFESQTKNKLGNRDLRKQIVDPVKSAVTDFLHKNSDTASILEEKIDKNEKLRKELATVKKKARTIAKKASIKIPNLKDCKYHITDPDRGEETTLFITEGLSASGSMVSARDPNTQAVFSLKGKPKNLFGHKRDAIYKNEELYSLMMAMGIEDDLEHLRYNKIVIATDADVDGFHIRNLLLTFFLSYFEELVVENHIYILDTPLFRVRNKKETRYCYNETERIAAQTELSNPETTRFKGLGEISPDEFGQFIGDTMRLVDIQLESLHTVKQTLQFYMGKNTPQRRTFIEENLV
ncbi:DNA topoisomerase IV subunit B [Chitinivibrio alkaliphilus]|uniref:DNA topoisomerase (ATP-hydrolyzing) n=1 Tax=Chitinivibrio alkaliphilus ACht1 TaxID=1313304 RepID=U7D9E8_9BACT|nr:DNA topoisomerase IV subunit B [Chitinivibrio alkaliphilus]ERP32206.1 DNA topoisomerase IV subunit B [Chitinivibrio alkaliphilus ACht1]